MAGENLRKPPRVRTHAITYTKKYFFFTLCMVFSDFLAPLTARFSRSLFRNPVNHGVISLQAHLLGSCDSMFAVCLWFFIAAVYPVSHNLLINCA